MLNFSQARVLVVGDVMLDRYWFGDVYRISPEAPVPVINVEREEMTLGGAANVARNICALGGNASLLSIVGADDAGHIIDQLTTNSGINGCFLIDKNFQTIVKLRILARRQQLLRADFENRPLPDVLQHKLEKFSELIFDHDLVIFSDYAKGSLFYIEEMISLARNAGKKILVDPKGNDYSRYFGATLITPNRSELRQVIGEWKSEEDLLSKATILREQLGLEALLLTRSEEGMTLFHSGGSSSLPTNAKELFDVSGAGDTVIATLGLMIAIGANYCEAMRVSNLAAGIVVGKLGTAFVNPHELESVL